MATLPKGIDRNQSPNSHLILASSSTPPFTPDDVTVLKYVCSLLSHRCALLVAIPLACLIRRMGKDFAAVAVTGSMYKCHPRLKSLLEMYMHKYSPGMKSETFLSDDGSGMGAGLVAAIAVRVDKA